MLFRTISYLKFLLKSTNQHGVHSPFVYDFVTKGLYKKENNSTSLNSYSEFKNLSNKEKKVVSKIIYYFKIKEIQVKNTYLIKDLSKTHKTLIYSSINNKYLDKIINHKLKSCILINGIHQNKKAELKWLEIIKNKNATVTIDVFYFGIIFFRSEQEKEHFNIRS